MLPFTKPTEYGLGKSGWVSASFSAGDRIPVDMLKDWIDESYRAQAPKKLVARLAAGASAPSQDEVPGRRRGKWDCYRGLPGRLGRGRGHAQLLGHRPPQLLRVLVGFLDDV